MCPTDGVSTIQVAGVDSGVMEENTCRSPEITLLFCRTLEDYGVDGGRIMHNFLNR